MNALELTQRQRELLGNIVKAANQYRQAVADASARLEHENAQIEQSRRQERQRIEEERKRETEIAFKRAAENKKEQYVQRLQREIAAQRSMTTLSRDITTIEAVKRQIDRMSPKNNSTKGITKGIKDVLSILVFFLLYFGLALALEMYGRSGAVWFLFFGSLAFGFGFWFSNRNKKKREIDTVNRIVMLHSLYDRWLELVDEQAGARRAESQRRYDQAFAQAKGQMLAVAEQSRPAMVEFGALTERVSPSWESEAWRQWEPGRVGPGAVRLGTFKMEV